VLGRGVALVATGAVIAVVAPVPTTAPVATSATGSVSDAIAADTEGRGSDSWTKSWQPSTLCAISSVFRSNSLLSLSLSLSLCAFLSLCLLSFFFSSPSLFPSLFERKTRGRENERVSESERK